MRPQELDRQLKNLEKRPSKNLDLRITTMISQAARKDAEQIVAPRTLWRKIMDSKSFKVAAAIVFILTTLLLAQHFLSSPPALPDPKTPVVESDPMQERLDQERKAAESLRAQADVSGLINLLRTGLAPTQTLAAHYLGELGDATALADLQNLTQTWKGDPQQNPFKLAIEQIQGQRQESDPNTLETVPEPNVPEPTEPVTSYSLDIHTVSSDSNVPLAGVTLEIFSGRGPEQIVQTNDQGLFTWPCGSRLPGYTVIEAHKKGYVGQCFTMAEPKEELFAHPIIFNLEPGAWAGGQIQDPNEQPIDEAKVSFHLSDEQEQPDQPVRRIAFEGSTNAQGKWQCQCVPAGLKHLTVKVNHPDYAADQFTLIKPLEFQQFYNQTLTLSLAPGISITGQITDLQGQAIAQASVVLGDDYWNPIYTDAEGFFQLPHLKSTQRTVPLMVQAKGFAPKPLEIPSESDVDLLQVSLEPGQVIRGRIEDAKGHPIAQAWIVIEKWQGRRALQWQTKTDAQGNFSWDSAPNESVPLRIMKSGYQDLQVNVTPNDQIQSFVLTQPAVIHGTVTDAVTGEPIDRFKLTPGIHWINGTRLVWQNNESWFRWFEDGKYTYEFSHAAKAYGIKITVPGYIPFESRSIQPDEGEVECNVVLQPGEGPSGYVYTAEGQPVSQAEVFWESHIMLRDGHWPSKDNYDMAITDESGRFQLKARAQGHEAPLLAIADQGIAILTWKDFQKENLIVLEPWARITGQLRIGSQPAIQETLHLAYEESTLIDRISVRHNPITTDSQGHFTLERVYPGDVTLYGQRYHLEAGQTLDLQLGGKGYSVRGEFQLDVPEDIPLYYHRLQILSAEDSQAPPRDVIKDKRSQFHLDNLTPGCYILKGTIAPDTSDSETRLKYGARIWHSFTLPPITDPEQLDHPIDLGNLMMTPGSNLRTDHMTPSFDLPTLKGERLSLTDLQKKIVLLLFYNSGHLQTDSTILKQFKQLSETFSDTSKIEIIAFLHSTRNLALDQQVITELDLHWPHVLTTGNAGKIQFFYNVKDLDTSRYDPRQTLSRTILLNEDGRMIGSNFPPHLLKQAIEQLMAGEPLILRP